MDMKLLDYHDSRLSPEARWLVMQWSSIIGLDQSTECSLQDLFARLGLTYAQGRRAWDVLTDKVGKNQERFIEIERLPCKGPGRPASRYRLSAKLVKALEAKSSLACKHHTEEIKILAKTTRLSSTVKIAGVEERGRSLRSGLPLPNRWLLMVLLAHADAPGIVTCLSVSALRRLTGMSSFRITNQLKKLRDLGLIAHHQPGLYSSEAGARKTSIYIFDLSHPLLGQRGRESVSVSSLPSSVKNKRTELLDGIVDAVMAAGVCSRQIEALLTTLCAIDDAEDDAFNSATENARQENDSAGLALNSNIKRSTRGFQRP